MHYLTPITKRSGLGSREHMILVSRETVVQSTSVPAGRLRTFLVVWRKWGSMTRLSVSQPWMRTTALFVRMYIRQSITMNYERKRTIPSGVPSICRNRSRLLGCCSQNQNWTASSWQISKVNSRMAWSVLPMWPTKETTIFVHRLPKYSVQSISLPMSCLRKTMSRLPNRS